MLLSVGFCLLIWALITNRGLAQQDAPRTIVTGVTTGINQANGEVPVRKNIDVFVVEGGPEWDLYIYALAQFQNRAQDDPLSYFQISGIHGRPYIAWGDVGPPENKTGTDMNGYCHHAHPLFTLWHRPYVALFEQIISTLAIDRAKQYLGPMRSTYMAAAEVLRVPYWDWASGNPSIPISTTWPSITIQGPQGPETIKNPLYSFKWPVFPLNGSAPWFDPKAVCQNCTGYPETKRWPDAGGSNQDNKTDGNLQELKDDLRDGVYRVFAAAASFNEMASTAAEGASFESRHDAVHNAVSEIMANLEISAFEPLFWLHHANVDRLTALWQAVHPDDTFQVTPYAADGGLYATAQGEWLDGDSPLKPFFRDANGAFHTSRTVANTTVLGYAYPETQKLSSLTPNDLKTYVTAQVNILYSSASTASSQTRKASSQPRKAKRETTMQRVSQHLWPRNEERRSAAPNENEQPETEEDGSDQQFYFRVSAERADFGASRPCTVRFYLRDQPLGRMAVLSMPRQGLVHDEFRIDKEKLAAGGGPSLTAGARFQFDDAKAVLGSELRIQIEPKAPPCDPGSNPNTAEKAANPLANITSLSISLREESVTPPTRPDELAAYRLVEVADLSTADWRCNSGV